MLQHHIKTQDEINIVCENIVLKHNAKTRYENKIRKPQNESIILNHSTKTRDEILIQKQNTNTKAVRKQDTKTQY